MPRFKFAPSEIACPRCGTRLLLRATSERYVVSLAHGEFEAVEEQGFCPNHPKLPVVGSLELARLVAASCNVAYDVVVRVGFARFIECRQLQEIRAELLRHHAIDLSVRTIG